MYKIYNCPKCGKETEVWVPEEQGCYEDMYWCENCKTLYHINRLTKELES